MTQHFTQSFVDHRRIRPASQRITKFSFHHRKCTLRIGAFVVVLKEFVALVHEKVKQFLPESALASAVVNTERNVGSTTIQGDSLEVFHAGISLIAKDFIDL